MITASDKKKKTSADRKLKAWERRLAAKGARRSAAFCAASRSGNIDAQIALVMPIARYSLLNENGVGTDSLIQTVADLVGNERGGHGAGADWNDYCNALTAAFAIGVAMGQLLTPGFFKTGGAR